MLTHQLCLQVSAALTPVSDSQVDVQFKQFKILGLIPITAPESAKGSLSVSYLDEELRISRGDKGAQPTLLLTACLSAHCQMRKTCGPKRPLPFAAGNLFVLVMDDSSKRP